MTIIPNKEYKIQSVPLLPNFLISIKNPEAVYEIVSNIYNIIIFTTKFPGKDLLEIVTPLNEALVPIHTKFNKRNLYLIEAYLNKDQTLIFGLILITFRLSSFCSTNEVVKFEILPSEMSFENSCSLSFPLSS